MNTIKLFCLLTMLIFNSHSFLLHFIKQSWFSNSQHCLVEKRYKWRFFWKCKTLVSQCCSQTFLPASNVWSFLVVFLLCSWTEIVSNGTKKFLNIISYSFTPSDVNFQTILKPKVILANIYFCHKYRKYWKVSPLSIVSPLESKPVL